MQQVSTGNQCRAVTNSENRCPRQALPGRRYCWQHDTGFIQDISLAAIIAVLIATIGLIADIAGLWNLFGPDLRNSNTTASKGMSSTIDTLDAPTGVNTPVFELMNTQKPVEQRPFYNLPPAILINATGLYASPNRAELIIPAPIPTGETVFVMGRNVTHSHLRVVWHTGVGWVPTSFTSYSGQRERIDALPVFGREPPACAVPLTTQFGLSNTWTSDREQEIVVLVDLFRSRYGEFPISYLSLVVNGMEVESSRRKIVERGQFSLKDVVFSLPQEAQVGDTVAYMLETSSNETLTFMATIFSVPNNCKWKLD